VEPEEPFLPEADKAISADSASSCLPWPSQVESYLLHCFAETAGGNLPLLLAVAAQESDQQQVEPENVDSEEVESPTYYCCAKIVNGEVRG
jgi:hypothetical protein